MDTDYTVYKNIEQISSLDRDTLVATPRGIRRVPGLIDVEDMIGDMDAYLPAVFVCSGHVVRTAETTMTMNQ